MAHKPDSQRKLSMKTKLIFIAIMFVVINLIFYVFDPSDESENQIEIDDYNQLDTKKNTGFEQELKSLITP
jgi:hypothetical protein